MNYKKIFPIITLSLLLLFVLVSCSRDGGPDAEPTATAVAEVEKFVPMEPSEKEEIKPEPTEEPGPTAEPAVAAEPEEAEVKPGEEPIYLSIIWHQHQPVYFKDPETNTYIRPWVRMHATKDYVDMASILEQYPDINATYNLTPSLIQQLDDLAAGAKDLYWTVAEIPASELSDEQKQFTLDRFFDTNRRMIDRFPRYRELLDKRDNSEDPLNEYTTEDYRDLQILFNLAWVDPDWLAEEPLASLVAKERDYEEGDKATIFAEHLRLIEEVIPVHKALQDSGQIEITTTPLAHPILPLLVDSNLAREALPDIELPGQRFVFGQDAVAHVEQGVALYEDHFGQPPRGMWPAEGSVAQEIVTMVSQNGIQWMATDEGVLANSLGADSFTRDAAEVVVEADQLYRPYYVQGSRGEPVAMVFRDVHISDKVGFTYSGMPGEQAAEDFVNRVHAIRDKLVDNGAEGPHLVSVILDGENAWEHYENDGKEFLHTLYQMLSDDPSIKTVTPSQFLEIAPEQPMIEDLHAGSWINHDFSTWIGEEEENRGWEYLYEVRDFLQGYITGSKKETVTEEELAAAVANMYAAEGSDWFWWYGADQTSGDDGIFDQQYRDTLKQVYVALGEDPPPFLDIPIIPERAAAADRPATDLITPEIDGQIAEGEWDAAGQYLATGGAMAATNSFFDSLSYGLDAQNLYLNVLIDEEYPWPEARTMVQIYLRGPGVGEEINFSSNGSLLGFAANGMVELIMQGGELIGLTYYQVSDGDWSPVTSVEGAGQVSITYPSEDEGTAASGENLVEMAIPLSAVGSVDEGSLITFRAIFQEPTGEIYVEADRLPATGPAVAVVPDLGTTTLVVDIVDPDDDDHGPGTYLYPQDAVFNGGNFDIQNFQVGFTENDIIFKFYLRGPIDNVWDSGNGLSLQSLDVYIDQDGDGSGGEAMLPGRNLSFEEGTRWDYAIAIEGWTSGIYTPGEEGPQEVASGSEFLVLADPGLRKVTVRVPKSILGDDPENWRYAAVIMSQEGYPSSGVMRVRDVVPAAEQWRVGGAPEGTTNHTRIIDLVWPEAGLQEEWLADFTGTDVQQTELTGADFAQVPMFGAD